MRGAVASGKDLTCEVLDPETFAGDAAVDCTTGGKLVCIDDWVVNAVVGFSVELWQIVVHAVILQMGLNLLVVYGESPALPYWRLRVRSGARRVTKSHHPREADRSVRSAPCIPQHKRTSGKSESCYRAIASPSQIASGFPAVNRSHSSVCRFTFTFQSPEAVNSIC